MEAEEREKALQQQKLQQLQESQSKLNNDPSKASSGPSNPVIIVDDKKIKALEMQLDEEGRKRKHSEILLQETTNQFQTAISEKRALENQVQELKNQVTNQQSKFQSIENQLKQEAQNLEKKLKDLQANTKELETYKSKLIQMERENKRLSESLEQIQSQAKNSAKSNASQFFSLQQQLDQGKANFNKEKSQLEDQIRTLTNDLASIKESLQIVTKEKSEWEEGQHPVIQGLRRQLQEQLEANQKLENKIHELEQQKKDNRHITQANQAVRNYNTIRNMKALEEELEEQKVELKDEDKKTFPSLRGVLTFSDSPKEETEEKTSPPLERENSSENVNVPSRNAGRNTLKKERTRRSIYNVEENENTLPSCLTLLQTSIHNIFYFALPVTQEDCKPLYPFLK